MPELRAAVVYDCIFPINTGGGERVYRSLAEGLTARGVRVDYITRRQWEAETPDASFGIIGVSRGEIYDGAGSRTAGGALRFALGVFHHFVRRRKEYDLVIASALPVLTVLAVRLATMGSGTRIVADWLEVWSWRKWRDYSGFPVGAIAWILQWVGVHSSRYHSVNSAFTGARIRRIRRSARIIELGLVDMVASPSQPVQQASDPPYALFVGRLIEDKRVGLLPAALAVSRETLQNLRLVVVGEGPDGEKVRAEVERTHMTEYVALRGKVDDRTLAGLFAHAAVLVNPSAREGFGLVVTEAAAAGVPSVVVAAEDNASVELIVPGVNGFVAASPDAQVLAAAIVLAVSGGASLRDSSRAWFESARIDRGLDQSISSLLVWAGRGRERTPEDV